MPARAWDKGPAKFKFKDSDELVAFCRQYKVSLTLQEAAQTWFDNGCTAHIIYDGGFTKVVDFKAYDEAKYPEYVMKPVRTFELTQTFDRVYPKGEISVPGDFLVLSYMREADSNGRFLLVSKKTGCVAYTIMAIEEGYVTANQLDNLLPEYTIFHQGI